MRYLVQVTLLSANFKRLRQKQFGIILERSTVADKRKKVKSYKTYRTFRGGAAHLRPNVFIPFYV